MRKLLILMLVFGLASLANAAVLELSVNGSTDGDGNVTEITIEISDTLLIDVYSNTAAPAPDTFWFATSDNTKGEWYTETLTVYAAMGNAGTVTGPYVYYGGDWWYGATNVFDPCTPPGPGVWVDVVFHCLAEGDVFIHLYDAGGTTIEDSILIHQVPEPATIALLGLGSLFLLRRRK
jgi:hypothetical protein